MSISFVSFAGKNPRVQYEKLKRQAKRQDTKHKIALDFARRNATLKGMLSRINSRLKP